MYYSIRVAVMLISVVVMGSACSENSYPHYTQAIEFADQQATNYFVSALKKEGVNFYEDKNHKIWYSSSDEKVVEKIKKKLLSEIYENRAISFPGERYNQMFIDRLKKAGISYQVQSRNNRNYIVYNPTREKEVKRIIDDIKNVVNRDMQKSIENTR